jgi:hypothetical protein
MDRLNEVMDAVAKVDSVKMRELAGYYSDEAAVVQDDNLVKMAMLTYCLHKTFIKVHMREKTQGLVESTLKNLNAGKIDQVLTDLDELDRKEGLFEGGLLGKSRIKIASRLYSHGISAAQSASMTGCVVSDLLDYIGETKGYQHKEAKTVVQRLNIARGIFK